MRIVGIDPSSSICGLALVENDKLIKTDAWFKPKQGSSSDRLVDYYIWLQNWLSENEPEIAVIEYLSVIRNAEASRIISHYQAVSALVCKLRGLLIVEARVTSARKAALGKGNLSKQQSFDLIKKRYPNHNWGRIDNGGGDRTDALVLALACFEIAEK